MGSLVTPGPGLALGDDTFHSEFYLEGITMLRMTTPSLIIAAFGLGFATVFQDPV